MTDVLLPDVMGRIQIVSNVLSTYVLLVYVFLAFVLLAFVLWTWMSMDWCPCLKWVPFITGKHSKNKLLSYSSPCRVYTFLIHSRNLQVIQTPVGCMRQLMSTVECLVTVSTIEWLLTCVTIVKWSSFIHCSKYQISEFPKVFSEISKMEQAKNSLVHPEYTPWSRLGLASSPTGNSQVYHPTPGGIFFRIQNISNLDSKTIKIRDEATYM